MSVKVIFLLFIVGVFCKISTALRIVNGSQDILNEFPQMVSIKLMNNHICGGTLLNGNTVLTSAHCIWDLRYWDIDYFKYYNFRIFLREYDLHIEYETGINFQVRKIIIHPLYTNDMSFHYGNDVALIKFDGYIENTDYDYIKYNILDIHGISKPGDRCEVVGWGSLLPPGENTSGFLQKAYLKVISNVVCSKVFYNVKYIDSNICAFSENDATSACKSDSGGPLFCIDDKNQHIQVGILSYGYVPCGKPNIPTVYTRISTVAKWISDNSL